MLKKTMTYTDYDGNTITEDFMFNLTKAEILEMQFEEVGGFEQMLKTIVDKKDVPKLSKVFKEIILKSYGVKSADGKRFSKNPDIRAAFEESPVYSDLYVSLVTDAKAAADFILAVLPSDIAAEAKKDGKVTELLAATETNA